MESDLDPRPATPHLTATLAKSPADLRFEGALFAHHSLAVVNRELASRLSERGHRLSFERREPDAFVPKSRLFAGLQASLETAQPFTPDVTIRHHWPPNFERIESGALVVIQPWEYGSLPRAWVAPIRENVDEIWVPTQWVRSTYLKAGIDPARVHVVPNGVDTRHFTPRAAPRALATTKTFKFLFVGGALPRKGVHVLLEAWKRAFTAKDDVALVIKDFGAASVYRGQTLRDLVQEAAARVDGAEIVYCDDTLDDADMPGLFTACDALVHPYLAEGFGLPIAEAMACALPVIVTGGGAALDFCDDDCTYLIPAREARMSAARVGDLETLEPGLVFEPDVAALAEILRQVVRDPEAARAKGRRARQKIRSSFTWEHAVDHASLRLAALTASTETPLRSGRAGVAATAEAPVQTLPVRFGAAPFNWSGYARITRMLLPALANQGVEASLQPYQSDRAFLEKLGGPALRTWRELVAREPKRGVHVAFHPPVGWDGYRFLSNARTQNPRAIAHVGFTMFETDRLPSGWVDELARMDEVWVPCRFNVETFANAGVPREKLRLFQPGLDLGGFTRDVVPYPLKGAPAFTFLSVFQWTRRKGWDVLLESFVRAFTKDDDVRLVIRAYPGERKDPPLRARIDDHLRTLGIAPEDAPRIELIEEFVSEDALPSLYAAADAYVLPTRGEGFGLPYLEALAAGLPTIGTNWGGQLDFLDDDVGYLIDSDGLEPVDAEQTRENPYYEPDHMWARPNVAHTAQLMRRVFTDREDARAKGARGRERVFSEWSAERGAQRFAALTHALHEKSLHKGRANPFAILPPVTWHGPLLDMSGYADEGRDFVAGMDELGLRVRALPAKWGEPLQFSAHEAQLLSRVCSTTLFERSVVVQHGFGGGMKLVDGALKNVGRTMFETDRAPAAWVEPLNALDEIWVPSRFQVEAFARSGVSRDKLHVVHGTLDVSRFETLPRPLAIDGRRGFNFVAVFDWSQRKGWDLLVRAFVESFKPSDDVALVLKVHSSLGLTPEDIRARLRGFVRDQLGRDPDAIPSILLLTARTSRDDMVRLYAAADAYVMPSRGEGWGRPLLEAMAAGLPVIGTRFGGSLEFMDDDNSFLVDAHMVDVPSASVAEQPLYAGHRWGEPALEHLKELMQRVRRDRATARKVGARARESALSRFDRRIVALQVARRIEALTGKGQLA